MGWVARGLAEHFRVLRVPLSLALVMFFACVGFGFDSMHRAVRVFWWEIDRVELEIVLSDADHVVPHAGWNDERPIVLDLMAFVHRVS